MQALPLAEMAAGLSEWWSQLVVGEGNGSLFKVAKGVGSTEWHTHEDQDEVFLVLDGTMTISFRDRDIEVRAGQLAIIPAGVEHRPGAAQPVLFLVIGRTITSNAAGGKPDWSRSRP